MSDEQTVELWKYNLVKEGNVILTKERDEAFAQLATLTAENQRLASELKCEKANRPFYKELGEDFEEALGPHPTIPNGQEKMSENECRVSITKTFPKNMDSHCPKCGGACHGYFQNGDLFCGSGHSWKCPQGVIKRVESELGWVVFDPSTEIRLTAIEDIREFYGAERYGEPYFALQKKKK